MCLEQEQGDALARKRAGRRGLHCLAAAKGRRNQWCSLTGFFCPADSDEGVSPPSAVAPHQLDDITGCTRPTDVLLLRLSKAGITGHHGPNAQARHDAPSTMNRCDPSEAASLRFVHGSANSINDIDKTQ